MESLHITMTESAYEALINSCKQESSNSMIMDNNGYRDIWHSCPWNSEKLVVDSIFGL
jgi:hypothetical protein